MKHNIVLIEGVRTPFLTSGTDYKNLMAHDLARYQFVVVVVVVIVVVVVVVSNLITVVLDIVPIETDHFKIDQ